MDFGLGYPEMIVILVILLVLFGGLQLPTLVKGLGESIRNFQNSWPDQWRRNFQNSWPDQWRRNFQNPWPEQWWKQFSRTSETDGLTSVLLFIFILGVIALATLVTRIDLDVLTGKQALGLVAVLSVWLAVGYFCFGRRN